MESLRGLTGSIASLAGVETESLLEIFIGVMLMFMLRVLLRRTWLMVLVASLLVAVLFNPGQGHPAPYLVSVLVGLSGFWFVFLRFGLLPIVVGSVFIDATLNLPLTFDLGAWWSTPTWLVLLLCLGIAGWGFWTALAGRPVFRDQILGQG